MRPPPYVAEASAERWVVKHSRGPRRPLAQLGFRRFPLFAVGLFHLAASAVLRRDGSAGQPAATLGIAYGFFHGWSPSQVVQKFRDDGLFEGPFTEMSWTGTGWQLREI
jgi:hypothetical protein